MSTKQDIKDFQQNYNWQQAFSYARQADNPVTREVRDFSISDVTKIVATDEGENDGPDWVGIFKCGDVYLYLHAGCDYTGWDCQAGGAAEWHKSLRTLKACIAFDTRNFDRLFPKKD